MSTEKTILGIVPGLQATALLGENLKLMKNKGKGKFTPKKFVKTGVTNLVGIGMIGATSKAINDLP